MSDPVSALNGASFRGIAEVAELGLHGMITLRGDLTQNSIAKAAKDVTGLALPARGQIALDGDKALCWMSPDEALVLLPYADAPDAAARMQAALAKDHALVVNVSDARASFRVSGPHAREVLAKLAPVDLSPQAFGPGMFRRTKLAQVPAAFWMADADSFQIVCFRSVAQYVFDLLSVAAQDGSEVGVF